MRKKRTKAQRRPEAKQLHAYRRENANFHHPKSPRFSPVSFMSFFQNFDGDSQELVIP